MGTALALMLASPLSTPVHRSPHRRVPVHVRARPRRRPARARAGRTCHASSCSIQELSRGMLPLFDTCRPLAQLARRCQARSPRHASLRGRQHAFESRERDSNRHAVKWPCKTAVRMGHGSRRWRWRGDSLRASWGHPRRARDHRGGRPAILTRDSPRAPGTGAERFLLEAFTMIEMRGYRGRCADVCP